MKHLLKQISYTTTALANKEREQLYRDVDEKLEKCLEMALSSKKGGKESLKKIDVSSGTLGHVWYDCSEECGEPPKSNRKYRGETARTKNDSEIGNGSYNYCVCCAESSKNLNALSKEGKRDPIHLSGQKKKELWTLAERAFLGTKTSIEGPLADSLKDTVKSFKMLYGDIVLKEETGDKGEPVFSYVYQMPAINPEKLIALYKNRCYYPPDPNSREKDLHKHGNCNIEDEKLFNVKMGICPALMLLASKWDVHINSVDKIPVEQWVEASSGMAITGEDMYNWIHLGGDKARNIPLGTVGGLQMRVIESWCNASAVVMANNTHRRFSSFVNDHITLNQNLTQQEKARLLDLTSRYTQAFLSAEADFSSRYRVMNAMQKLRTYTDRKTIAQMGDNAAAIANNTMDRQVAANMTTFQGSLTAPEAAGGGGGPTRRKLDFSDVLPSSLDREIERVNSIRDANPLSEQAFRNLTGYNR